MSETSWMPTNTNMNAAALIALVNADITVLVVPL
jgi:hypothetical protein